MVRWFLSYHSADQALAERLKAAIEDKDADSRVFFAPSNLRAGGSWSVQLAKEIADATAFILLIGEAGIGKWQVPEYDEALDRWVKSDRKFPLIVILLEGQTAPGLPFLRQLHWIVTPDPSSEKDIARVLDALSGTSSIPGELWRYASPYRGLESMEEKDSDFFFGRGRETVSVLSALAAAPERLPLLVGNSGVGKSSLAQAGVLAALKRQAWPEQSHAPNAWPALFHDSRQWCFLTLKPGTDPLKALVETFLDTWQFAATDPERVSHQRGWIDLLRDGKATLRDLIDATERRREELNQSKAPGFFLYVDQGEELYARAEDRQRRCFSELFAHGLKDPRLHAMMSLRSDFLGHLQNDEPLFNVRQHIDVPPLREAELREIISRPAQLLSARFETEGLIDIITRRTAEDSIKDVGALPLLSYTLDDMWTQMVSRSDGTLRLPAESFELGGVLVERADKFLMSHPGTEDALRHVLTLRLATVRDDGEPTRRRAARAEFSDEEWRLVSDLADFPNRLLVTITTETGETFVEVAHEAIFRRWTMLRDWIAAERDFLVWRSGIESARRAWQAAPEESKSQALLMGFPLAQATEWLAKRSSDIPTADREFTLLSRNAARRRRIVSQAVVGSLALVLIASLIIWLNEAYVAEQWRWFTTIRPYIASQIKPYLLSTAAEQGLQPGDSFRECAKDCPEMVVIPSGQFLMGSPETEAGRFADEGPQHQVTITQSFAMAKQLVTFDDWNACVSYGNCPPTSDLGWGQGQQPVIFVSWNDAQLYVAWLSKMTGKPYRLPSEAEWEFAVRAGSATPYSFGDDPISLGDYGWFNANSGGRSHPVGLKKPNAFGLYDMHGNTWEWVEDCFHSDYVGAPTDGSAWITPNCIFRTARGGTFSAAASALRSANRFYGAPVYRVSIVGFRVARQLSISDH